MGHKFSTWVKWTKRVIVDDGHLVPQLVHIWNLIIRHRNLFYASRSLFVPQMVNSLSRLGLPVSRPVENRKLAGELTTHPPAGLACSPQGSVVS